MFLIAAIIAVMNGAVVASNAHSTEGGGRTVAFLLTCVGEAGIRCGTGRKGPATGD
jgi:hypothetical protein